MEMLGTVMDAFFTVCMRCISYCKSVRPSVCPSVRHLPLLCQNDGT